MDTGVRANNLTAESYAYGNELDVFLKSFRHNSTLYNNNLLSQVGDQLVTFVDWFNTDAYYFWVEGLNILRKQVGGFDGLQLDISELKVIRNGEIDPDNVVLIEEAPNKDLSLKGLLPFQQGFQSFEALDDNSISMNAGYMSLYAENFNMRSIAGHGAI